MSNDWRSQISQPRYDIKVEKDVYVPVRDGVRLCLNIYRPDTEGKFPALLAIGGYGKELQEELMTGLLQFLGIGQNIDIVV